MPEPWPSALTLLQICQGTSLGPLLTTKQRSMAFQCALAAFKQTRQLQGLALGLAIEPTTISDNVAVVEFLGSGFSALLLTSKDELVNFQCYATVLSNISSIISDSIMF